MGGIRRLIIGDVARCGHSRPRKPIERCRIAPWSKGQEMVETYRRDLISLMARAQPVKGLGGRIECKHFFGGAAGYVNGRIFVTLTPVGLALKLPEDRCAALLKLGATPLRYFPKAPIKKDYVILPEGLARDAKTMRPLLAQSVGYCLAPRRANGLGANAPTAKAKRHRPASRRGASPPEAPPLGTRISELRNLGPVSERQLAEIGIADAEALRAAGATEAYARLKWRPT